MISVISSFILIYFFILWVVYTYLFVSSIPRILQKFEEIRFNNLMPDLSNIKGLNVTVMMPVMNYEKRIGCAIDAILKSDYPNIYFIVINDGSNDNTLLHLVKRYDLEPCAQAFRHNIPTSDINSIYQSKKHPHFLVIDKKHQQVVPSAADCLNAALNLCRTPLCMTIDSDTIVEPHAISNLIYRYLTTPHCVAVGGSIYIPDDANDFEKPIIGRLPTNPTLGVQVVEFLRSFIYGHEFWSGVGGALCYPGAFTLFETKRLIELGGYDAQNYSYDAEIIMRIHHDSLKHQFPYYVYNAPSAIAWACQPRTLKGLWAQRNRWQRGLLRSLGKHKAMFLNPRFGKVGLFAMPFYAFFEIYGPVVEGLAYLLFIYVLCTGQVIQNEFIWYILLAWGFIFVLSLSCVLIDHLHLKVYQGKWDFFKLIIFNLVDVLFYRPFRGFCAVFASLQYFWNRLLQRPL